MSTREEDTQRLAQAHYAVDSGITKIFRVVSNDQIEQEPDEPIKLLEVNEDSLPFGIRPVYFRAQPPWISYPSAIIEITPDEYDRLVVGDPDLRLPAGWRIGDALERTQRLQEIKT